MKFSIDESRIVGLVDDILLPEIAVKLGLAIGTFFGKKSVIAASRDFRSDSHMIKRTVSGGLMATGIEILDLHAAPTSTLQFIVRRFGCDGGLSFTGAHYLEGEVSIRILDSSGNEVQQSDLEKIAEIAELESFDRVKKHEIGSIEPIENAMQVYRQALSSFINRQVFNSVSFRVVLDLSLGPLSVSIPSVFSDLNIDVVTINAHRTNIINKEGEIYPNPHSLRRVSHAITAVKADVGIILDVEGIKVVFIDDKGIIYPPEDTAAFLIYYNLKKRRGNIVLSKLFTKRFDHLFQSQGAEIIRTPDLPGNIGRIIASERAVIGATDNGKLFQPIWGAETDGTLSALAMLDILAVEKKPLSSLFKDFENLKPPHNIVSRIEKMITLPEKLSQLTFFRIIRRIQKYRIRDSLVGIKLDLETGTCHYMTSLNEREIKIIIESDSTETTNLLLEKALELSKKAISSF